MNEGKGSDIEAMAVGNGIGDRFHQADSKPAYPRERHG